MQLAQQAILGFTRNINPIPVPNQVTSRTAFLPFTVGGNDWQGRLNCVINDLGEWVIIWNEGTQHSDPSATTSRTNIAFSNDEGATWSDNNEDLSGTPVSGFPLTPQSPAEFIGDFNFIKCPNGDLVLICQERGTGTPAWNATNVTQSQYRSTDHGKTWAFEFDFCVAIGEGGSVDAKGKIQGNYENMVTDGVVYIILCQIRTDLDDTRIRLYKSIDNCATYTFVSNPVEYDEATPTCTESSIADLGNGKFFCIFRTENLGNGVWKRSEDYGLTWGSLTDFAVQLGYVGIHQPRVMKFSNFFLLMGRDNKRIVDEPNVSPHDRCSFWTTTDLFQTARRQYLDPFYAGTGIGGDVFLDGDSGYARALQKQDGSFMFFGYWGVVGAALMYKYDVSHTNAPSTEHYANNEFLPETITSNGVRLQLNRDNIFPSISAPTLGGIAIIGRAHNYLKSGDPVWTPGGATPMEIIIVNDKGWGIFTNGRLFSGLTLANLMFKASFSVGFWLWPDDGQPAATGMIMWSNSNTTSTLSHGVQIQIETTGKMRFRYAVAGTLVTALTDAAVFANGTVSPKHIAITVTSGDLMRVYVDGSLVTLDAANLGDMSTVTMASFSSAGVVAIGTRQTGASTFDLPYIGRIREFMIQPVVWSVGNIGDIMLN